MEQKLLVFILSSRMSQFTEESVEMLITERRSLCDLVLTDFLQMLAPYR